MVFVSADGGFEKIFKQIRRECSSAASYSRGISLLIVVPLEVDALCACRSLAALLAADYIPFKILPIRGLEDILRINEVYLQAGVAQEQQQEMPSQSIFFINCAGSMDISSLLSLSPSVTAYVLDSHRPIHLANIFDNSQVVVFDDGGIEANYGFLKELFLLSGQDEEEEERSDSNSQDEDQSNGSENDEDQSNCATNEALSQSSSHGSLDPQNLENSDNLSLIPSQLPVIGQKFSSLHNHENLQDSDSNSQNDNEHSSEHDESTSAATTKEHLQQYYSTKFYGSSASCLLYALCSSLGKESNEHLWNAIVGVTEQLYFHRISPEQYEESIELLREEVIRLNCTNELQQQSSESFTHQEGRIAFLPGEYKFYSHRHWNLYESMKHSEYIATRLGIWKEKGLSKLDLILAKMAVPIREANQDFGHLSFQVKNTLFDQIIRVVPEWGLDQITFPSFVRSLCYGFEVSSSDMVNCVVSWLAVKPKRPIGDSGNDWYSSFFDAYKYLEFSTCNLCSIQQGIRSAIGNQTRIVKQVCLLLSRHCVKQFKYFRFAILKEYEFDRLSTLVIGNWLSSALQVGGKHKMPILIAALQNDTALFAPHYRVGFFIQTGTGNNDEEGDLVVDADLLHSQVKNVAFEMRLEVEVDGADWWCQAIVPVDSLMTFVHKIVAAVAQRSNSIHVNNNNNNNKV